MQLSTATVHRGGVTLVHVRLRNDGRHPRRVRVANRLDGPVWFPRRGGYPAAGWDDGGYEGVLRAGERRALGYACPADPADPPAEIAWTERAADSAGSDPGTTVAGRTDSGPRLDAGDDAVGLALVAARALAEPRPPRGAVPSVEATAAGDGWPGSRPADAADGEPASGRDPDSSRRSAALAVARKRLAALRSRLRAAVER